MYMYMYVCVYSSICNIIRYVGNVSGDETNNNTVVAKDPSSGNRRNDEGFEARQMTRDRIKVPICPKCHVYENMSNGGLRALRSPKRRPKGLEAVLNRGRCPETAFMYKSAGA